MWINTHQCDGISYSSCPAGYYETREICLVYPVSSSLDVKCHNIIIVLRLAVHACWSSLGALMSSSTIDRNGNPINNGTLPLQSSAYSCPNSTQLTSMSTIDRPNSNSSNVYQTIDADRFVTCSRLFSISMFDLHHSNKYRQECIAAYLCLLSSNSQIRTHTHTGARARRKGTKAFSRTSAMSMAYVH